MYQVTFLHALCKTICAYSETQISKFSLQLLKMSSSKANPLSKLHLNDFLIRWGQITNLYLCVCFSLVSFIRSVYAPVKLPSDFLHCFHFNPTVDAVKQAYWKPTGKIPMISDHMSVQMIWYKRSRLLIAGQDRKCKSF